MLRHGSGQVAQQDQVAKEPQRENSMKTDAGMKVEGATRNAACFVLAAAMVASPFVDAHATAYTVARSGNWGDPANWTPTGFPNAATDTATVKENSYTMTLADINTNDASFTISALSASTGSMNFTLNNVADGTGKLIFDNPTGNASIYTVKNGKKSCNINVGIVLNTNLSVKSLSAVGAAFNREISSGAGRRTGLIIASQSGTDSASTCVDVKINAAASYTGETRIMGSAVTGTQGAQSGGGKLMLGLDNALPVTTVLRVDGATTTYYPKGGILKLEGKNQEVAGVYGAAGYNPGQITTSAAATLTINAADDHDFAGCIGGTPPAPLSIVKKGASAQTLSGPNTYTGDTRVEAGTLVLAETGELRFVIENDNVANRIGGAGAVELNGLFRLDIGALTDTVGTWRLVDTTTLTASFGPSFNLAFEGGPAFRNRGGGVYTCTNGWVFTTADGNMSLTPGTAIIVR